ncbi:VapC toxin family PIN domain ribonuclease, partial [Serratia sp. T13T92]
TLLASTLITPGARLWTLDKRLERLAKRLNASYQPVH